MTAGEPPVLEPETELVPGYEVLEHMARGQALDVYDVWSAERDCHCVAKLPRPDRMDHAGTRRRLVREGEILLPMTHPHVVRAYELVRRPTPVLILELLTGGSVQHVLDTSPRRPPLHAVVELGIHLCSALHYVHGRGLLHADLKPGNVMTDRGFAKLVDFSLARAPGRAKAGRGTRGYLAPEQARGGRVWAATDVWGLGATMYRVITGESPFPSSEGGPRYPQLERLADPIGRHRRLAPEFKPLEALLTGCLEPEARRRPTLEQVTDVLDALVDV
jgi:eukaryotic-like serine/threonine-protein kinase